VVGGRFYKCHDVACSSQAFSTKKMCAVCCSTEVDSTRNYEPCHCGHRSTLNGLERPCNGDMCTCMCEGVAYKVHNDGMNRPGCHKRAKPRLQLWSILSHTNVQCAPLRHMQLGPAMRQVTRRRQLSRQDVNSVSPNHLQARINKFKLQLFD
jgi:hypothetical protein